MKTVEVVSVRGASVTLRIDGRVVTLSEEMAFHDLENAIFEEDVHKIVLAESGSWNTTYHPEHGTVKWFKDELDQIWVKLTHLYGSKREDVVAPASRVVKVVYLKPAV